MTFQEWFYSAPHRAKYTNDHSAYLAAQEAWEAAHEACAKVCETHTVDDVLAGVGIAQSCAAEIRARGKHETN